VKIYWAGPLFTTAERAWNRFMVEALRKNGHDVFLPQEDEPREKTAESIFEHDVDGLETSDVVVAVVDGADPDSGTSWEIGYAYSIGMPIVLVRTDFRGRHEGVALPPINIMLAESANEVVYVEIDKDPVIPILKALDKLNEVRML